MKWFGIEQTVTRVRLYLFGIKVFSWRRGRWLSFRHTSIICYPKKFKPGPLPEIYDVHGDKMDIYYLRDNHYAHIPHGTPVPTRFLWDRFDYSLDTHFYANGSFFDLLGDPGRRFALFMEPETICPHDYRELRKHKPFAIENFLKIFTHSERILNEFPNAEFFPVAATPWRFGGGKQKSKNISVVSSEKTMCDLHKLRLEIARKCRDEKLADAYGTFTGTRCETADYLDNYRYCIMVENEISNYYFTERLTSCFATRTIPIYMGCPNIGKWFNTDGIVTMDSTDALQKLSLVLSRCNESDYAARLPAIEDNYNRVKEFTNVFDNLYEKIEKDRK